MGLHALPFSEVGPIHGVDGLDNDSPIKTASGAAADPWSDDHLSAPKGHIGLCLLWL